MRTRDHEWAVACFLLGVLLTAASGCTSAPANEAPSAATPSFSPATRMGVIQESGTLRVGVPRSMPPWAFGAGGRTERGFMVDIARYMAGDLGVRARFVSGSPRAIVQLADAGRVDMAFSLSPITAGWLAEHVTSNPYFVAHQRLLVKRHSNIRQVSDLRGKRVCQAIHPVTEVPVEELRAGVRGVVSASVKRCVALLRAEKVDAVTAADVKLMPASAPQSGLSIVGDELSTEGYGIVGAPEGKGWAHYLNTQLSAFKSEGAWIASYNRWIADRVTDPLTEAPHMTSGAAAALFPEAIP